jgi:lipoic acid synthetase
MKIQSKQHTPKPAWLKKRLPSGPDFENVKVLINKSQLHTVCQEARCPNIWECFSRHTATFLILGDRCTRKCRFCAVTHGPLTPPDPEEPIRVAKAAQAMGLQYVVITSVTRDDLPDGGAGIFAETIRKIRNRMPETRVEVLIPDFQGDAQALERVLKAKPNVLNHNIETVPRLYSTVRPEAVYTRSLELLNRVRSIDPVIPTKSGLMLGLGETSDEIRQTLEDLLDAGCHILTLGQYLQPTHEHLPVDRYVSPGEFEHWQQIAYDLGFSEVASGPFVRSSYQAHELFKSVKS